jgi:hypothetical protein
MVALEGREMLSKDSARPGRQSGPRDADNLLLKAFARLDPVALGLAVGVICGLGIFVASVALLVKGGDPLGPRLALLGQYFIGYTVTPFGSLIGLVYGLALGFALGWTGASLRNFCLAAYLHAIRLKSRLAAVHDVLDPP